MSRNEGHKMANCRAPPTVFYRRRAHIPKPQRLEPEMKSVVVVFWPEVKQGLMPLLAQMCAAVAHPNIILCDTMHHMNAEAIKAFRTNLVTSSRLV